MALILACIFAATAVGGEVTPALQQRLATAPEGTSLPVIVTLADQVDAADYDGRPAALMAALRQTAHRSQPRVLRRFRGNGQRFWLVNAVAGHATPGQISALRADPTVESIDLDRPVRIQDAGPRLVNSNPFPNVGRGAWGLSNSRVPQAWQRFRATGKGVVVGSIDTGVDPNNPDIAGKIVAFRDFVNGRTTPYDDNGHGTHTIGTMIGGARGGSPIGVAPDARVVVAKAADAHGHANGSDLLAAAEWMTDPDGNPATTDHPVVINNSWAAADPNDPWFRSMVQRWLELGIVPVFASGNNGPGPGTVGSPASYPEVLAVGAAGTNGALSDFTARGPVSWQNRDGVGPAAGTRIIKPDLVAPGVNVVSSVANGYVSSSGTSMAAPHVAGAVALVAGANPQIRGTAAIDLLRKTSTDLGAPGPDARYGAGQLNVEAAVARALGQPASTRILRTRFTRTPGRRTTRTRVMFQVRVEGTRTYRWRVNQRRWSRPTTRTRLVVNLQRGVQVVETQAVHPVAGRQARPTRAVVRVTPPARRIAFQRAR